MNFHLIKQIKCNTIHNTYRLKELSDINNIDIAVKHRGIIKNGTFNPDHREPDYEREKELKRQARLKQERYLEYKKQRIQRIRVYILINCREVIIEGIILNQDNIIPAII